MRFFCNVCIFFAAIFISSQALSQNNLPLNSAKILVEGSGLYNEGKYKEAIEVFKKIPSGDTNYVDILYNISLALYQDSNFVESKQKVEEGIRLFPEKNSEWYNLLANNLDKLGKQQEAIAAYDKIIQSYYNQYLAWYNKGITYYNLKQMEEAKKCFQQSLLINPYYPGAHYFLGMVAYKQGNMVPAVLSLVTSLVINPESKYRTSAIVSLSNIAKVTDEVSKNAAARKSTSVDDFEILEEILLSKISLDKQYKLKSDLEDPIVRQLQVVLEKLTFNNSDKGFWMQYYVPFYTEQYKEGRFDALTYEMLSGLDMKEVQSLVKKNKKKVEGFVPYVVSYFNNIRETQVAVLDDRKLSQQNVLYGENTPVGKGKVTGQGKETKLVGPWEFYYPNGQLKSKGLLNDKQEKMGEWVFYHQNGKLKERSFFKESKAEGKSTSWYDNGQINTEDIYKSGENDGLYTERYYSGLVRKTENYAAGKKQGEARGYTSFGTLEYVANYSDDKEEGTVTYYHQNGKASSVGNYVKGEAAGNLKYYYQDGTLKLEGVFANGKRTGTWKGYYNNGTLKNITNYNNGDIEGEFKEFYDNGKTMTTAAYVKGKIEGKYEEFDSDGKPLSESNYEKGRLREIKFFDKTGKVISNTTTRNGAGNLVFYDARGNKTSEGYFTKEGLRSGKTTYYYRNGKISSVANFKDGLMNGESVSYYKDGSISSKVSYKDDEENDYKTTYHENGNIKSGGFVANGVNQGTHREYDEFGKLHAEFFYVNGDLQGNYRYYHPNGKPEMELDYTSGWLNGFKEYDTTGKVYETFDFPGGNLSYKIKTYSGKTLGEGTYKNHYINGERKFFYPDGSLSQVQNYKYNILDSFTKKFHYGGKTELEGQYKMGEKDGKWSHYFNNGQLYFTEAYNNGRLNGITKTYNEDGTLDKEISYKENNLDGEYKIYGDNGQLAVVLNYEDAGLISYSYEGKDGKLIPAIPVKNGTALVVAYYKNGVKSVELNFEEDEINGVRKVYYSTGKIYIDGARLLGYEHGVKKIYYTSGQLKQEENYYYGNLHGSLKKYYDNGKLKADENWYNGQQHDASSYYDNTGKLVQTRNYYYGNMQWVK